MVISARKTNRSSSGISWLRAGSKQKLLFISFQHKVSIKSYRDKNVTQITISALIFEVQRVLFTSIKLSDKSMIMRVWVHTLSLPSAVRIILCYSILTTNVPVMVFPVYANSRHCVLWCASTKEWSWVFTTPEGYLEERLGHNLSINYLSGSIICCNLLN